MDLLGPDNSSTLWKKMTSFASWTSAFEVPDWSSVWNELVTKKLPMFSSSLNEVSGDCEKIVNQCDIPKHPGNSSSLKCCPIHPNWVRWTKAMNNQTHRRSVRERLIKYTAKYKVADWVEIHVGKRQDSIRSDGDGLPWQEYIGVLVRERLRKYTAK